MCSSKYWPMPRPANHKLPRAAEEQPPVFHWDRRCYSMICFVLSFLLIYFAVQSYRTRFGSNRSDRSLKMRCFMSRTLTGSLTGAAIGFLLGYMGVLIISDGQPTRDTA